MRRGAASRTMMVLAAALILIATSAAARPGGGSSFSGGSHGGGGGGFSGTRSGFSGGGFSGTSHGTSTTVSTEPMGPGQMLFILFVLGLVVGGAVLFKRFGTSWQAAAQSEGDAGPETYTPPVNLRLVLEGLRAYDPDFSVVIFEDFLYALYAESHHARGAGQLARLSAYLSPGAQAELGALGAGEVRDVVIGAMRFAAVDGTEEEVPRVTVDVIFETNYTQATPNGVQSYYAEERWALTRKRDARSRAPDRAHVFACPSCGGPLDVVIAGTCGHCHQAVASGDFDWVVTAVGSLAREPRGPMLTSTVEEQGTDLPTVRASDVDQAYAALTAKDPQFDWNAFTARVALIFGQFQVAWSGRDLLKMRPFLSERLFAQQVYWVEAYKKQGLRNLTDGAKIEALEIARVSGDKYFDAITVRLCAVSQDYTVDDKDHVVSGKKGRERRYTEYWTLIRGAGRSAKPRTDLGCPNCGAPLEINMAGDCKYCRAKVTTGEFDWVLSRIEQDEVYVG